jgi:hypothetical protein
MVWTRLISWLTSLNRNPMKEAQSAMSPSDATALAIFMFEGGNQHSPSTRNIRNLNPGNLRPYQTGQAVDSGGYRVFATFIDGYIALLNDIKAKVARMQDKTMLDFFNVYAPGADHNDPHGYAQFVIGWLTVALAKPISLATTIKEIYD